MNGQLQVRRVVIATEFWHGATGKALAEGLRLQGWDVAEVNILAHMPQSAYLPLRLAAKALQPISEASYNEDILAVAKEIHAEFFIAVKGIHIRPQTLKILGELGVKRVLHYPDVHFNHVGFYDSTLDHFDLIVSTKRYHIEPLTRRLGEGRAIFQAHGYSPDVHRPRVADLAEEAYEVDVGYVGNYSPQKAVWFEAIAQSLPHVSMRIIGNRWTQAGSLLEPYIAKRQLMGDFAARAMQTSRINVAVHWGPVGKEGWEDLVSTRTFEIPACRGFMLHPDNQELRGLFVPATEVDVFSSPSELVDKVAFYLGRPELRRAMIARAYDRAVPAYSYHNRASELAQILNARGS